MLRTQCLRALDCGVRHGFFFSVCLLGGGSAFEPLLTPKQNVWVVCRTVFEHSVLLCCLWYSAVSVLFMRAVVMLWSHVLVC